MSAPADRHDPFLWLVLALVLLLLIPAMLMMAFWGTPMMGSFSSRTGSGVGWIGIVLGAVAILLILWLLVRAAESAPHVPPPPVVGAPMTGREILDARYARGEIPREDYLRMREDLEPRKP